MPQIALKVTVRTEELQSTKKVIFVEEFLNGSKSRNLKFNRYKTVVWAAIFSWADSGYNLEILCRKTC